MADSPDNSSKIRQSKELSGPAYWPKVRESAEEVFGSLLASGDWGGHSGVVIDLENRLRSSLNMQFATATSSCTMALYAALSGLGVSPGDEVIVPAYTFAASAYPVVLLGGTPVVVDVNPETLGLDPGNVTTALSPRTKAIVTVHYAGYPGFVREVGQIARDRGIALVEDAAHCAPVREASDGSWCVGDAVCFSFQQDKLVTAGEGGAVVTNDSALAAAISRFIDQGRSSRGFGELVTIGCNGRMTAWQAAVIIRQLDHALEAQAVRTEVARRLLDLCGEKSFLRPMWTDTVHSTHWLYTFVTRYSPDQLDRTPRDLVLDSFQRKGIPVTRGYRRLLTEVKAFDGCRTRFFPCPEARRLMEEYVGFGHRALESWAERFEDIECAVRAM